VASHLAPPEVGDGMTERYVDDGFNISIAGSVTFWQLHS
jgi:hypothetical protein